MGRLLPSLPETLLPRPSRSFHFFPPGFPLCPQGSSATKLPPPLESPPDVPAHHVFEPRLQYSPPPPISRPRLLTRVSVSSLDKCGKAMEEGLMAGESQLGLLCPRCAVPPLAKVCAFSSDVSSGGNPFQHVLGDPVHPTGGGIPRRASVQDLSLLARRPHGSFDFTLSLCGLSAVCARLLSHGLPFFSLESQHWLDISSRKLHRPAVCELCLYKYRRRRVLKV